MSTETVDETRDKSNERRVCLTCVFHTRIRERLVCLKKEQQTFEGNICKYHVTEFEMFSNIFLGGVSQHVLLLIASKERDEEADLLAALNTFKELDDSWTVTICTSNVAERTMLGLAKEIKVSYVESRGFRGKRSQAVLVCADALLAFQGRDPEVDSIVQEARKRNVRTLVL